MKFTTASSTGRTSFNDNLMLKVYILIFSICWAFTFLYTTDVANWWTENMLTIVFLIGITTTYKKFKFSDLSYTLMFLFILLHIYGSQYTYAENPFGKWLQQIFHSERNHYDRIVHFGFGFMLSYPMRDYFKNWFQWPVWVCWVLPCEITLSFSGMYELLEWGVADIFFPAQGHAYLGSQGDVWDAQKDMGLAFFGSVSIMIIGYLCKKTFDKRPLVLS